MKTDGRVERPMHQGHVRLSVPQHRLFGQLPPLVWAQLAVVVILWGVRPNVYGAARLRRR